MMQKKTPFKLKTERNKNLTLGIRALFKADKNYLQKNPVNSHYSWELL